MIYNITLVSGAQDNDSILVYSKCLYIVYIKCFEKKNMIRFALFRKSTLLAARTMGFSRKILELRNQWVAISGSAIGDDQREGIEERLASAFTMKDQRSGRPLAP